MDRITLVEQKLEVLAREFTEVLRDIQTSLEGITKGNKMAFEVAFERIRLLEEDLAKLQGTAVTSNIPSLIIESGKEL